MQNQNMNLVLSTDAKPRLKWTHELHLRFVEAVSQLGGPEKATPKSLMRVMGIPGLTLYHLKSHLQKYRLGKSPHAENSSEDYKQEDYVDIQGNEGHFSRELNDGSQTKINESLKIAEALQLQMEVQRKLHEQIEVQRHLQMRIEAQGKYLQSVLKKAQETLAGYSSSAVGIEFAKSELTRLLSMVNNSGSCVTELTEARDLELSLETMEMKHVTKGTTTLTAMCSMESSLTSSESSARREENAIIIKQKPNNTSSVELPLMDIVPQSENKPYWNNNNNHHNHNNGNSNSRKRNIEGVCVEQQACKRSSTNHLRKSGLLATIDLNSKYQNDIDSGPKALDLNCK